MSVRELWYKFLAAIAKTDGHAPGLSEDPPEPRELEPHMNARSAHEETQAWKAHGGDRH
jgi:hypothetical protein